MRNEQGSRLMNFAAILLCLGMLFVMLLSPLYLAMEIDHDCHGDDCPICELIARCENTLRQFSGLDFAPAVIWMPFACLMLTLAASDHFVFSETLVSQKIRLND